MIVSNKDGVVMPILICPVCGLDLNADGKSMRCRSGHCYDIAKQGYVNLLMSNKASVKRHGDDRAMVRARTSFLEKGYYLPLLDCICEASLEHSGNTVDILDAGCGEGWYSAGVKKKLEQEGRICSLCGIDISREALIAFSKRVKNAALAVAGINALPIADSSCDLVLNVFAPNDDPEFYRVLRHGGILIRAVPAEDHLFGLKKAVYDKPYLNNKPEYSPEGFTLLKKTAVRRLCVIDNKEDINSLFMMTPYYYKTGRDDQKKLLTLDRLETEFSFIVFIFQKN